MRRKIIQHGPSSLSVSLPYPWVRANNLSKGDEIEVDEMDSHLVISPVGCKNNVTSANLCFSEIACFARKDVLQVLQKKGIDQIHLTFDSVKIGKELAKLIQELHLGYEIIKSGDNYLTLKAILNPEGEELQNLIKRMFLIALEYFKKVNAVLEKNDDRTDSCVLHENSIHRLAGYCRRILSKSKVQDSTYLHSLVDHLETITEHLSSLLNTCDVLEKVPQEVLAINKEVFDILYLHYTLYYKFSLKDFSSSKKALLKLSDKIRGKKTHVENYLVSFLEPLESVCSVLHLMHQPILASRLILDKD